MLLPEVKTETCNEILELLTDKRGIVSILDEIEGHVDANNRVLHDFLEVRCCKAAKYFRYKGDAVLVAFAGRLGAYLTYEAIARTLAGKNVHLPHVTTETIGSFTVSASEEFGQKDSGITGEYLKMLGIENPAIANILMRIAKYSPDKICGETSIIFGSITYFLLGRQCESDLLEMMLEE